jgi:hypothetical protein
MNEHRVHEQHAHTHGPGCGHRAIKHGDHFDYLHDGHIHRVHGDHVDDCLLNHPAGCTPSHRCGAHSAEHVHGEGCGHEAVPHLDHIDYLVAGHLHHPHGSHCDDHGHLEIV